MDNRLTQDIEALLHKFRAEIHDKIDHALRDAVASVVAGRPSLAKSIAVKQAPTLGKRKVGRPAKKAAPVLPFAKLAPAAKAKRPVGRPAKAPRAAPAGGLARTVDNAVVLELLKANPAGLGLKAVAAKLAADKEIVFKSLKGLREEKRVKLEGEKRSAVYKLA